MKALGLTVGVLLAAGMVGSALAEDIVAEAKKDLVIYAGPQSDWRDTGRVFQETPRLELPHGERPWPISPS